MIVQSQAAFAAQSVFVNDSASLLQAYQDLSTSGGGTIYVSAGSVPIEIMLSGGGDDPVRLMSADPQDPVELARIKISDAENITLQDFRVDSSAIDNKSYSNDMEIFSSSHIKIHDVVFYGGATSFKANSSDSVSHHHSIIRNSSDIEFSSNTISNYFHGFTLWDTSNVLFKDNDISQMQGDGLRMEGVQGIRIEGNKFHDFLGSAYTVNHDDMIQLWSVNTDIISRDIEIIDNVFMTGDGPATQTILLQNEQWSGNPAQAHQNITISGNVIYNGHTLGIRVSDANNVAVENNTLLWDQDATMSGQNHPPAISLVNVENATVLNNIAPSVPPGTAGDNFIIDYNDVTSPNYVGSNFVNALASGKVDLRDLALLSDSAWVGAGAAFSQPDSASFANQAVMTGSQSPQDIWTWSFDASLSTVQGSDLSYVWTFPDGSTQEGVTVLQSFSEAGTKTVTLEVRDAGQTVAVLDRSFEIEPRDFVAFDFVVTGIEDLADAGAGITKIDEQNLSANGYRIGNDSIHLDRATDTFHNLRNFGLEIELDPVNPGSSGTFLHFHKSMGGKIAEDGSVHFSLYTNEGAFEVKSAPGVFSDGSKHVIGVVYDDYANELSLSIDGETVSSTQASGTTPPKVWWGLTIGSTWGSAIEADVGSFYFGYDLDDVGDGIADDGYTPVVIDPPVVEEPVVEEPVAGDPPAEEPVAEQPTGQVPDEETGPIVFSDASILLDFDEQKIEGVETVFTQVRRGELEFGEKNADGFRIGDGESLTMPRSLEALQQLDGFRLEIDMSLVETDTKGMFLNFHKIMKGKVEKDGSISVRLKTDEGKFALQSDGPVFDGTQTHTLGLVYDGEGGMFEMYADGELVGSTEATGVTGSVGRLGLTIGNGKRGADAVIERVEFEPGAPPAAPAAPADTVEDSSMTYFEALLDSAVPLEEMLVEEEILRTMDDEDKVEELVVA